MSSLARPPVSSHLHSLVGENSWVYLQIWLGNTVSQETPWSPQFLQNLTSFSLMYSMPLACAWYLDVYLSRLDSTGLYFVLFWFSVVVFSWCQEQVPWWGAKTTLTSVCKDNCPIVLKYRDLKPTCLQHMDYLSMMAAQEKTPCSWFLWSACVCSHCVGSRLPHIFGQTGHWMWKAFLAAFFNDYNSKELIS